MKSIENLPKHQNNQWNYHPDLPIRVSPVFRRPFDLLAVLRWIIGSWFPLSERLIILLLSLLSWFIFHPSIERCREFNIDWVTQIFLRNLALMFFVAGGLHVYLYIIKAQADERRYDTRPLGKNKNTFTFNNQVFDNMFWTCASGVTIWSAFEALMMWGIANEYVPALPQSHTMAWLILLIFVIPIWETFYFYLIHRLLHWPPLYRSVHALHHRNLNIGPWSGLSMHPVEHLLYLGSVLIHFVVPANPLVIIYHLQFYALSAASTHSGFEGLVRNHRNVLPLGTFHHQLHHRYYECNYGGLEIPWDKWFGSFHDGTQTAHAAFLEKRRRQVRAAHTH